MSRRHGWELNGGPARAGRAILQIVRYRGRQRPTFVARKGEGGVMNVPHRISVLTLACAVGAMVLSLAAAPQVADAQDWTAPRTEYGHPDIQGRWCNSFLTPLVRPEGQGPTLTIEEAAALEQGALGRLAASFEPLDPDRARAGRLEQSGRLRPLLRGLGRPHRHRQRRAAHVVHHASRERPAAGAHRGGQAAPRRAGRVRQGVRRVRSPRAAAAARTLPRAARPAHRPADVRRRLQQQLLHRPERRLHRHHDGAVPQRPHHPPGRRAAAARPRPPVARRLVGPLGGRYARRRDDQPPSPAARRAAERVRHTSSTGGPATSSPRR